MLYFVFVSVELGRLGTTVQTDPATGHFAVCPDILVMW